jgi:hypothetical protein
MKKKSFKLILLAAVFITASTAATAQIYVQIRPPVPVIVRTSQPSPVYVWVNEEWEPDGVSYRYSGGHWAPPPQPNYYYRNGYWVRSSKGQKWVKGGWYAKQPGNNGKHKGQYKGKHKGKH